MKKIPTLFQRDPDDMRRLTRTVHPDCEWVIDGAGRPTRKYDGTCLRYDGGGWWARREVKEGRPTPADFVPVQIDHPTGNVVGWEPIEHTGFARWADEALRLRAVIDDVPGVPLPDTSYELCGPKINGDPEHLGEHVLIRHGYLSTADAKELDNLPTDYDGLREWLLAHPTWEGIVWHHPTCAQMAKIKRRDFTR